MKFPAPQNLPDLQAAKREWSQRLLAARDPNVVGVGIGEKLVDGKSTGTLAVKFFVQVKYHPSQMEPKEVLPRVIDGLPTDVDQVGLFRRLAAARRPAPMPNPRRKHRPAQPGCSIGFGAPHNRFRMAGTFGALARNKQGLFVLSNNHVLADENRLPLGSPIYQPGLLDNGNPKTDQIAELARAVKLRPGVFNRVDAALARVSDAALVSSDVLFIGPPQGTTAAAIDVIVHKFGRTTGYRAGRITSTDTDVTVRYDTGNFSFRNQLIIVGLDGHPFSDAGDSGSLILERRTQKAVGLLFAGSPTHTVANPIRAVLRALRVQLAS